MSQLTGLVCLPGMRISHTAPASAGQTVPYRPLAGSLLAGIGVVHVLLSPVFYRESLDSIREGGVLASISADRELADLRSAGFWYATSGIGMMLLGQCVAHVERHEGTPPALAWWGVGGLAAWGTFFMPVSGFLTLIPVAGYAAFRRRRAVRG